ncbi:hypothetical protein ACFVT1_14170 [Streptomyces sp. NPDC057963]|uniref:hypothetical protein n=1 Tax=Streptomyces sp. NPDC057963 TaxID=3346290 RepID=UPI0036EBB775
MSSVSAERASLRGPGTACSTHHLLGLVGSGPSVLFRLLSGLLADPLCLGLGLLQAREHWDQFG